MKDLHFLQGLEENYTNITEKDDNSIYITKDTLKGFLGDKKLWVTESELNSIINNINNKLDEISGESYGTTHNFHFLTKRGRFLLLSLLKLKTNLYNFNCNNNSCVKAF